MTSIDTASRGRETLDQILARHALAMPQKLAIADFGDRAGWTTGSPRRLTYGELDACVDKHAAFFHMLGLATDTVVAVQMPPTVDAVIVMAALWRAGLIAAPMPLALREADLTERLALMGAKAIVTQASVYGEPIGERLRDVAAELFNIRFVFCSGGGAPDGLVDMDRVFAEPGQFGAPPMVIRKGNPADAVACLSWLLRRQEDKLARVVLPRTHNGWLAAGLMTGIEAAIDQSSVVVSPFALSGLKGLGIGLMPWLIAGATLVTGLPDTLATLVNEARHHGATHVLVPNSMSHRLSERLALAGLDPALVVIHDHAGDGHALRSRRVTDVTLIGEHGLMALARTGTLPEPLPSGPLRTPSFAADGPVLIETRIAIAEQPAGSVRVDSGEIYARGPMVPEHSWQGMGRDRTAGTPAGRDGFIATGVTAAMERALPNRWRLARTDDARAGSGQLEVDLEDLDRLLMAVGSVADAAAIAYDVGGRDCIGAVIVPKPGTAFDATRFLGALSEAKTGHHRLPEKIFLVPEIARSANGRVLRAGMAARLSAMV